MGGRRGEMREWLNGPAWLLGACLEHHELVTSPAGVVRRLARLWGWVLIEGEGATTVPVLTRHDPEPILLADDGRWATYEEVGC